MAGYLHVAVDGRHIMRMRKWRAWYLKPHDNSENNYKVVRVNHIKANHPKRFTMSDSNCNHWKGTYLLKLSFVKQPQIGQP